MFTSILTMLKGLSWVQTATGIAGLGFLGPVPAIIAGVFQLIWKAVVFVLQGLADIVAQPHRAVTVVIVVMVALLVGNHYGKAYDKYLVLSADTKTAAAKMDIASLEGKLKAEEEADDGKAKAAKEARDAAKTLPPVTTGALGKPSGAGHVHTRTGSASAGNSFKIGVFGF